MWSTGATSSGGGQETGRQTAAAEGRDGIEALDAVVVRVGDVDVPVAVDGDRGRLGEFTGADPALAPLLEKAPVGVEHLDAVVFAVDDVHVAGGVDGDAGR